MKNLTFKAIYHQLENMDKENIKSEIKNNIDVLFDKINELEAKKDEAVGEAKEKYAEKLEELKATKENLSAKYDEIMDASEEKWEELKDSLSSSLDSFKEGFSKIGNLFK